jgi:glycosyltransferase involved in cell wall biosynthesis
MQAGGQPLSLSVVVPAFNAPENLERCLAALAASTIAHELVVVDDCSTERAAVEAARRLVAGYGGRGGPGRLIELERNSGPGVARNRGAEAARGAIVAFVDSDVLVRPDTLERLRAAFEEEPAIAAVFGSYDDRPASPGVITEYRNLLHHWVHQSGPREATTFWAGCGAMRREAFLGLGGFDAAFDRPAIEDIELGMRAVAAGLSIRLRPEIQVTHLKRWRLFEMIRVDVTCRAIPWTRLLIERPGTGGDLNLEARQKWCVVLAFAAAGALVAALALPGLRTAGVWAWGPFVSLLPILWINRGFYLLCWRHKGPVFALASVFLHLLYYLYGGAAFLYVHVAHRLGLGRKTAPAG